MAKPESSNTFEWHDKQERPPSIEDADGQGCVISWHEYDGVLITGWRYVMQNQHITHWTHTPSAPNKFGFVEGGTPSPTYPPATRTEGVDDAKDER